MATTQLWELTREGRHHVLTATSSGWSRTLEWRIDEETVVTRQSSNDRLQLDHDDLALDVRFSALGAGRRATLHSAQDGTSARTRAEIGIGGADLVPAPGSPAAKRAQWISDHPRLHTLRATLVGAAGVVVPLLLAALLARFAFSFDWPSVPFPDLPDIPWPGIPWPDISLPDLPWPDWSVPGWVSEVLDLVKFVIPVVIAFVVARAEIRRHRKQREPRADDREDDRE